MASMKEKVHSVLYHVTKPYHLKVGNAYGRDPLDIKRIKSWYLMFQKTGALVKRSRVSICDETDIFFSLISIRTSYNLSSIFIPTTME